MLRTAFISKKKKLQPINIEEDKAKSEDIIQQIGRMLIEQVQFLKSDIEKQEEAFQKRKILRLNMHSQSEGFPTIVCF